MKQTLILFIAFLVPNISFSQQEPKTHVVVLDVTASMSGHDGSGDIWSDVKNYLNKTIDNSFKDGDSLYLYKFGSEVSLIGAYKLNSNTKAGLNTVIQTMDTEITYTCIYSSLQVVFNAHLSGSNRSKECQIYLYTDGEDSGTSRCPGELYAGTIVSQWKSKKGDRDFLYYYCFGSDAPEEVENGADDASTNIVTKMLNLEEIDISIEPRVTSFIFNLNETETEHSGFHEAGDPETTEKIKDLSFEIDERSITFDSLSKNSNTLLSFMELEAPLDFQNNKNFKLVLDCDLEHLKAEARSQGLDVITGGFEYKTNSIENINLTVPGKMKFKIIIKEEPIIIIKFGKQNKK